MTWDTLESPHVCFPFGKGRTQVHVRTPSVVLKTLVSAGANYREKKMRTCLTGIEGAEAAARSQAPLSSFLSPPLKSVVYVPCKAVPTSVPISSPKGSGSWEKRIRSLLREPAWPPLFFS